MDVKEAIKVIDDLVFAREGRHLEEPETVVIEAAWLGVNYPEMTQKTPYDLGLLQRRVAPRLWVLLTGILGSGEKVTKKRLRSILEQRMLLSKNPPNSLDTNEQLDIATNYQLNIERPLLQVEGGQPADVSGFVGREEELACLQQWVLQQRSVVVYGAAGIGKSALAAKLLQDISATQSSDFDCLVWKSVFYSPLLKDLLSDLIKLTSNTVVGIKIPESNQAKTSLLIEQLRERRCLVVLDDANALSQLNLPNPDYKEYETFFQRIVEEPHQSCLLITSQIPIEELTFLESAKRPVKSMKLEGLAVNDAIQLLQSKGLTDLDKCSKLVHTYRGIPQELEDVAARISHFFGGNAKKFVERQTTILSPRLRAALDRLFEHTKLLSKLQRQIMIFLAESMLEKSSAISFTQLLDELSSYQKQPISNSEVMMALESLEARALIESDKDPVTEEINFRLRPTIKKYILTDPQGLVQKSKAAIKKA